jgi:hypothetical protein
MVKKKEADMKEEKKETNMNTQLIILLLVSALVGGAGLYGGYQAVALGLITPPTPLSIQTVKCQEQGRRNSNDMAVYELIRTKGGCDMLAPYAEAYPSAPVPLNIKPVTSDIEEGETTPVGKP